MHIYKHTHTNTPTNMHALINGKSLIIIKIMTKKRHMIWFRVAG